MAILPNGPSETYSPIAKAFHWTIVILIAAQFTIAWSMPDISRNTKPIGLVGWHLSIGALILVLALARFAWRISHVMPPPPRRLSPPLQLVSRLTHWLLYALLIVLPLLGWANAAARGWTVKLLGVIPLPPILPQGSAFGRRMGDVHGTIAIVLLVVIGLHVAGALYHVLILRDRTLQRMV